MNQSSQVRAVVSRWGSGLLLDLLKRYDGRDQFDIHDSPLLIVHGTKDKVVPYDHAEELLKNYRAELLHFKLDGFGHLVWNANVDGEYLFDAVYPFMRRVLEKTAK